MSRLPPINDRTGSCPGCGNTWVATHTRPGRRRLWLWQQRQAHRCPGAVPRPTDPEEARDGG